MAEQSTSVPIPPPSLASHFTHFDQLSFLHVNRSAHLSSLPTIVINARNFPATTPTTTERATTWLQSAYNWLGFTDKQADVLFQYFVHKAGEVMEKGPYTILMINTRATWAANSPGLGWLATAYAALKPEWRARCDAVYVLHADLSVWMGVTLAGPLVARQFWERVDWVARVQLLAPAFDVRKLQLDREVLEHDAGLEGNALRDFGLVVEKEDVGGSGEGGQLYGAPG